MALQKLFMSDAQQEEECKDGSAVTFMAHIYNTTVFTSSNSRMSYVLSSSAK
jgi:hypothetical protein